MCRIVDEGHVECQEAAGGKKETVAQSVDEFLREGGSALDILNDAVAGAEGCVSMTSAVERLYILKFCCVRLWSRRVQVPARSTIPWSHQ